VSNCDFFDIDVLGFDIGDLFDIDLFPNFFLDVAVPNLTPSFNGAFDITGISLVGFSLEDLFDFGRSDT
jgi:hypothetical protein